MFEIRKNALQLAINSSVVASAVQGAPQTGKTLYDAGAYLNFLLNGMPIDTVPGGIVGPFPNTPEVLGQNVTNSQQSETATPKKAPKVTKAALSVVKTDTPATTAPPVAAVAPAATATLIANPTTIAAAAESLKALVQNQKVGEAPSFGRAVAVKLLEKFGVAQLAQIPATKLAEFKAECDAANTNQAAAPAADPTGGLLG
jgi:hypothetical protein